MAGPVVLSRTVPTTRSIVSAAWAGQSPCRPRCRRRRARRDGGRAGSHGGQAEGATGEPRRPGRRYGEPVTILRAVLGLVCAAAAAGLGALILGEYEFTGSLPYVAGPLFGLVDR